MKKNGTCYLVSQDSEEIGTTLHSFFTNRPHQIIQRWGLGTIKYCRTATVFTKTPRDLAARRIAPLGSAGIWVPHRPLNAVMTSDLRPPTTTSTTLCGYRIHTALGLKDVRKETECEEQNQREEPKHGCPASGTCDPASLRMDACMIALENISASDELGLSESQGEITFAVIRQALANGTVRFDDAIYCDCMHRTRNLSSCPDVSDPTFGGSYVEELIPEECGNDQYPGTLLPDGFNPVTGTVED